MRRSYREEGVPDQDMLHFNDMMETTLEDMSTVVRISGTKAEGTGTPNGYGVTDDGIQFHDGFLEDSNLYFYY